MTGATPELALGTANWGGRYGAPGREGVVDETTARALAAAFLGAGHALIDTAPAYSGAEEMVGIVLDGKARVVSKVPASVMAGATAAEDAIDSLRRSLARTRVARFAGVLLHDAGAAHRSDGRGRDVVAAVRNADLTDRVGVSVYEPAEAYAAVDKLGADLVQLPCNVFDQRFVESGCLRDLAAAGVEVHLRSVFLNGVVLADPGELDPALASLAPPLRRLRQVVEKTGRTPLELALAFARQLDGVGAVVVGALLEAQLVEILTGWRGTVDDRADTVPDWPTLAASGIAAIDPRTWAH